jgi:hypothetical protein
LRVGPPEPDVQGADIVHEGYATTKDVARGADYDWVCVPCLSNSTTSWNGAMLPASKRRDIVAAVWRVLGWLSRGKHSQNSDIVRIEGPLERVDDRWLLRIPLAVGGAQLVASTRRIGEIKGEILEIVVPDNLVRNLKLKEGQHLWVHNKDGKFTFEWHPSNDAAPPTAK